MIKDSQIYSFSNVHIRVMDKNMNITKEINNKNMITKYALLGIAKFIRGEFNQTDYEGINEYVPKYLAIGTNNPGSISDSTSSGFVTTNDTMLCSEVMGTNSYGNMIPTRIGLETVTRTDSTSSNDYVKIRYRAYVPSGVIDTKTKIRELGLFTKDGVIDNITGNNRKPDIYNGLFARIVLTEPITIPANSSLDVMWDVVLASSGVGVYPSIINLCVLDEDINPASIEVSSEVRVIEAVLKSHIVTGYSTDGLSTPIYKDVTYNYCEFTIEYQGQEIYDLETYQEGSNPANYMDDNELYINREKVCIIDKYTNTVSIKSVNNSGNDISITMKARAITSISRSIEIILKHISDN